MRMEDYKNLCPWCKEPITAIQLGDLFWKTRHVSSVRHCFHMGPAGTTKERAIERLLNPEYESTFKYYPLENDEFWYMSLNKVADFHKIIAGNPTEDIYLFEGKMHLPTARIAEKEGQFYVHIDWRDTYVKDKLNREQADD